MNFGEIRIGRFSKIVWRLIVMLALGKGDYMKKVFLFCIMGLLLQVSSAMAFPVDLDTFTADEGVTVSDGTVTFVEKEDYSAICFYNLDFYVENSASLLSFDYSLELADENQDWLVAAIYDGSDYIYEFETGESGEGSCLVDISPYQEKSISLIFGLESGDFKTGTVATISHMELTCESSEIPEPATIFLLGAGLTGLVGIRRKRFAKTMKNNM